MPRTVLAESSVHAAITGRFEARHSAVLDEVQAAVDANDVVVVGMAINPHPAKARRALTSAGIPFVAINYGSYFSRWHDRLALKMWTGWPTFPMVFVRGVLVGGASDLQALIASGEIRSMLAAPRATVRG